MREGLIEPQEAGYAALGPEYSGFHQRALRLRDDGHGAPRSTHSLIASIMPGR
jgi:hypothetical protein